MADLRLAHLRLLSQRIISSATATPVVVARSMLAMQAQDLSAAKWAVGLRAAGITSGEVDAALSDGTLVRSWPMRGTLHITAAEDLPWILGLTSARTIASARKRHADLGLDGRVFERAGEVAQRHLTGGKALTREALLVEFQRAGIEPTGQRGYHILWRLAQDGTICCGPPHGKQQTFVLLDEWVKHPRRYEREEALGELARRYFEGHGPATERDLAWWAKLTLNDVRIGLAVARGRLAAITVDGEKYLMSDAAEERLSGVAVAKSVVLLPGFDEYLLGYADRRAVLDPAYSQRIVPGGNGVFAPMVVVNGRVAGTWRRGTGKDESSLTVEPFEPMSRGVATKLHRAVAEYGRFLGTRLRGEIVVSAE